MTNTDKLIEFLSNPFVIWGIVLAVLSLFRNIPSVIIDWIARTFTVSLNIRSTEPAFDWFNIWVTDQNFKIKSISAGTFYTWRQHQDDAEADGGPKMHFTFANGLHFFRYKRKLMWIWRWEKENGSSMLAWRVNESVTVKCLGRNPSVMKDMLREIRKHAMGDVDNYVRVMVTDDGKWRQVTAQRKRKLSSVILADTQMSTLLKDVSDFQGNSEWYATHSIPYQRGYLFYGPPGTGKTSTVMALASHLNKAIYVLNLNEKDMSDKQLFMLMGSVPKGQIVLLEDVDSVFRERSATANENDSRVTFSGLLNSIDGVFSSAGRILCLTTNHIDKLDVALIRPGRVDLKIELGYATNEQIENMFVKFFGADSATDAHQFANSLSDIQTTMAEVQGYLLCRRHSSKDALTDIEEFKESVRHRVEPSPPEDTGTEELSV